MDDCVNDLTVFSSVTGDENSRSHVTVIVVDAGRPRQFKLRRHCRRAHGGMEDAAGGAATVTAADALAA